MKEEFNTGDVVTLKSGSLAMTVTNVQSGGYIFCIWMDIDGHVNERNFYKELLVKIEQP